MLLRLAIVTPDQEALDLECDEVVAPGEQGDIGLLAGHLPLISALRPGVLSVVHDGKTSRFAVDNGFTEIDEDQVTVLTEACVAADQVDKTEAQQDLDRAERGMSDSGPADPEYAEHEHGLAWARARLDAARA